ncbi:peptidoglycan editing factor PgeF [Rickettsia endosymbiont of Cardiosporidium cionae]|uniref:peptidoglycan editing factor PgeF n=1 Tax=Rickettsia endosymbiont of Cardiosporidium cionae TaxID=2777155 RepID=UPI0018959173|nr:peptidoglycan editing factor PgeF [Rickettsia endosymbiont of Cardiosporidium cionae]KAF8817984.1 peptidoglycan editing factor PgeF [Rickettsia endosymbiont of Cardiosporidium cionae]
MIEKIIAPNLNHPYIKHAFLTKNIVNSTHKYVEHNSLLDEKIKKEMQNNHKLALSIFNSNAKKINMPKQVHGNKVLILEKDFPYMQEPECDAFITKTEGVVLGVSTADCAPILLADLKNTIIAAIHAGWRGARADIISNVVAKMYNIGAKQISATIGPCIHQDSYEVDSNFYDYFIEEDKYNEVFFINSSNPSHYKFNLPKYIEMKLEKLELQNIFNVEKNSFSDPENFFSFRRSTLNNKKHSGHLVSMIEIVNHVQ